MSDNGNYYFFMIFKANAISLFFSYKIAILKFQIAPKYRLIHKKDDAIY